MLTSFAASIAPASSELSWDPPLNDSKTGNGTSGGVNMEEESATPNDRRVRVESIRPTTEPVSTVETKTRNFMMMDTCR